MTFDLNDIVFGPFEIDLDGFALQIEKIKKLEQEWPYICLFIDGRNCPICKNNIHTIIDVINKNKCLNEFIERIKELYIFE